MRLNSNRIRNEMKFCGKRMDTESERKGESERERRLTVFVLLIVESSQERRPC
jgi:hypothetical protein